MFSLYFAYNLTNSFFIYSHNVIFKTIPGAAPFLLILNEFDETLEKIDLAELTRAECNDLLLNRGFYKKAEANEEVPEKYKQVSTTIYSEVHF